MYMYMHVHAHVQEPKMYMYTCTLYVSVVFKQPIFKMLWCRKRQTTCCVAGTAAYCCRLLPALEVIAAENVWRETRKCCRCLDYRNYNNTTLRSGVYFISSKAELTYSCSNSPLKLAYRQCICRNDNSAHEPSMACA